MYKSNIHLATATFHFNDGFTVSFTPLPKQPEITGKRYSVIIGLYGKTATEFNNDRNPTETNARQLLLLYLNKIAKKERRQEMSRNEINDHKG